MQNKKLYIKDTTGNTYQSDVATNTTVGDIAHDFFETMDWPLQDNLGRGQRAVVEFLDPKTQQYIRLRSDQSLEEANIPDGAILSIYPEAIAGAVDIRRRLAALKTDYAEMCKLVKDYTDISFTANKEDFPEDYEIVFRCESFKSPPINQDERPEVSDFHQVKIHMNTEYPRDAPLLEWMTPVFHPNISTEGVVCLGQLKERYLPNLGLKRIVLLLNEMIHWRNYDFWNPFNPEAADWGC